MTEEKRKRGRPRGSGKNDDALLMKVAELRLADVRLKPTTAMRQVIAQHPPRDATPETTLRRLQDKWMKQGGMYMDRARQRQDEQRKAAATRRSQALVLGMAPDQINALLDAGTRMSSAVAAMRVSIPPSAMEAIRRYQKQIDGVGKLLTPEVTKMLDTYAQHMKAITDTPTMRALQDMDRIYGRSRKL